MPISQTFPIPRNAADFEALCLELLRQFWNRPLLSLFAKRGERQLGVDILDLDGEMPIWAAQCKLKEAHKSLSPAEIQAEVDKAKQFAPPLGRYAILTTGKVSSDSQLKVLDINEQHGRSGLFEVELFTWDRLCVLLQTYPEVQEKFYAEIATGPTNRIEKHLGEIKDSIKVGFDSITSIERHTGSPPETDGADPDHGMAQLPKPIEPSSSVRPSYWLFADNSFDLGFAAARTGSFVAYLKHALLRTRPKFLCWRI